MCHMVNMNRSTIFFGIGTVVVLLLGAIITMYMKAPIVERPSSHHVMSEDVARMATYSVAASPPLKPPRVPPAGFKEYRNEKYHFALFYPDMLAITEYDEGFGAMTITFENNEATKGFQIFIAPDHDTQISEERFRMDEPSGVVKDKTDTSVDGAPAVAFFGRHPEVGDTREVWFLHGGYIFEAVTVKAQEEIIGTSLSTWQFLTP